MFLALLPDATPFQLYKHPFSLSPENVPEQTEETGTDKQDNAGPNLGPSEVCSLQIDQSPANGRAGQCSHGCQGPRHSHPRALDRDLGTYSGEDCRRQSNKSTGEETWQISQEINDRCKTHQILRSMR
jgi:hypothetical protein